jgi:hypothetical protein
MSPKRKQKPAKAPRPLPTIPISEKVDPDKCDLKISFFDGTRSALKGAEILIRTWDGAQQPRKPETCKASAVRFRGLPFADNLVDNWAVVASADGYEQAGFHPVRLVKGALTSVDLMLLPKKRRFDFAHGQWDDVKGRWSFLSEGVSESAAKTRYNNLIADREAVLAAILNLSTALEQLLLPEGNAAEYIKSIVWDESLKRDRFFAFADSKLLEQVLIAYSQGHFAKEFGSALVHPGATQSYKQIQFGEANTQITFHEEITKQIGGKNCIQVEIDIDYYRDLGAHFLLEFIPNKLTGGLTNPEIVYMLRWIAGRRAGVPEFNPPFTIVAK